MLTRSMQQRHNLALMTNGMARSELRASSVFKPAPPLQAGRVDGESKRCWYNLADAGTCDQSSGMGWRRLQTEVLRTGFTADRFPLSAYPPALRLVFTAVLPIACLTTVPAEAILGRATPAWMALSLLVAAVSLALCRAFWRFALRPYTSASS